MDLVATYRGVARWLAIDSGFDGLVRGFGEEEMGE